MRLFQRRLTTMDVTIKNEDNRETHILSADDYYSYHGGLIAAVRTAKGSAPRAYVGDSSDRSRVVMRSLGDEIRRVVQGETQNPKFIEAMMKHGYKGGFRYVKCGFPHLLDGMLRVMLYQIGSTKGMLISTP